VGWATTASPSLAGEVHRIVHAVASLGGAVGWLTPPTAAQSALWLDAALAGCVPQQGAAPTAGVCVVRGDGVAQALGCWRRRPEAIFAHRATLSKIMAHPDGRGRGLGRVVTAALVDACRDAGMQTITLTARGNNHLAIAIYASLGFIEWGRLPDVIEVGDLRFDEVHMALRLPVPAGLLPMGSAAGPGSSPAPAA
jgi:ribosomal protein S18 acetylase RimI-like enzyme